MVDINNVDFILDYNGVNSKVGGLFKLDLYKSLASRKRISKGAVLNGTKNSYKVTNVDKSDNRMIISIVVN